MGRFELSLFSPSRVALIGKATRRRKERSWMLGLRRMPIERESGQSDETGTDSGGRRRDG